MNQVTALTVPESPDNDKSFTKIDCHSGIKVIIQVPQKITDTIRQQKINKIYDILSPKATE